MKKRTALHRAAFALSACLITTACSVSPALRQQAAADSWLNRTLPAREAELSRAYNTCNLHALRASMYAGTTIGTPDGRHIDPVIEARDRICGHLHREVLPGSLTVRPVGDHSALVTGTQRFCTIGTRHCGQKGYRFAHLWTLDGGDWQMQRMCRFAGLL